MFSITPKQTYYKMVINVFEENLAQLIHQHQQDAQKKLNIDDLQNENVLTAFEIVNKIIEKYPYRKIATNSIKHCLSFRKMFVNTRQKSNNNIRGFLWKLSKNYKEECQLLEKRKKRRFSSFKKCQNLKNEILNKNFNEYNLLFKVYKKFYAF